MQCAEKFPLSNFTGIDFYPIYPSVTSVKLINATFLRSNILDRLFFDDNTFDFVHMRCLNPIFTEKEWEDTVLKELIRVCKPGGWIELVELDYTYLNQGPTFKKVNEAGK
jgi:ubiquinone/menaquinone biosynthesis C-methylase UbiE